MRQRQYGMTMIGLLCLLAVLGLVAYAGIRLIPVYLNYMKIARTMQVTASEFKAESADPGAIRRSLERHFTIEDPSVVDFNSIEIVKDDKGVSMHLAYDDVAPYIANVSLSVHFDKTVRVE
jgi:Tfp pilus assembly protein PilE